MLLNMLQGVFQHAARLKTRRHAMLLTTATKSPYHKAQPVAGRTGHPMLLTTATGTPLNSEWLELESHWSPYAVDHCNRSIYDFLKAQKQPYDRTFSKLDFYRI